MISGSCDSVFSEYRFNRVKMTLRYERNALLPGSDLAILGYALRNTVIRKILIQHMDKEIFLASYYIYFDWVSCKYGRIRVILLVKSLFAFCLICGFVQGILENNHGGPEAAP